MSDLVVSIHPLRHSSNGIHTCGYTACLVPTLLQVPSVSPAVF